MALNSFDLLIQLVYTRLTGLQKLLGNNNYVVVVIVSFAKYNFWTILKLVIL